MESSVFLRRIPQIKKISSLAKKRRVGVWLVGGFLRDLFLRVPKDLTDFDFCVEGGLGLFVKEVSRETRGKLIILDKKIPSFRLVLRVKKKIYTYDFTGIRGKSIKEDLFLRDFTINTLALKLDNPKVIIDYYQARQDLRAKKIKALSEKNIVDDPLRILRGFSFSAQYDFRIQRQTLRYFCLHKEKIAKASAERVNEELFKILSAPFSYKIIRKMDAFKVIDQIIPYADKMRKTTQGGFHHLDVWAHSIETLKQFELLCWRKFRKKNQITEYLSQQLAQGRTRAQVLKIACLLHDLGKPFVKKKEKARTIFHTHEKVGCQLSEELAQKLRLSKSEKQSLMRMVFWHLRPGYLADQISPTKKAVYRFFRDTQNEGAAVIILSLADWRATRGPLTDSVKRRRHEKIMLRLIEDYFLEKNKKPLPKIINGYDLMHNFNLESGPEVGRVLAKIKEYQALGKIEKKGEALLLAKKMLKGKGRSSGLSR